MVGNFYAEYLLFTTWRFLDIQVIKLKKMNTTIKYHFKCFTLSGRKITLCVAALL